MLSNRLGQLETLDASFVYNKGSPLPILPPSPLSFALLASLSPSLSLLFYSPLWLVVHTPRAQSVSLIPLELHKPVSCSPRTPFPISRRIVLQISLQSLASLPQKQVRKAQHTRFAASAGANSTFARWGNRKKKKKSPRLSGFWRLLRIARNPPKSMIDSA